MSIQMNTSMPTLMPTSTQTSSSASKISDDQKSSIEALMSDYTSSELSEQDALEIVAAIDELGVMPGEDL